MIIYLFSRSFNTFNVHYFYDDISNDICSLNEALLRYTRFNRDMTERKDNDKFHYTLPIILNYKNCNTTKPIIHINNIIDKMIFDKL